MRYFIAALLVLLFFIPRPALSSVGYGGFTVGQLVTEQDLKGFTADDTVLPVQIYRKQLTRKFAFGSEHCDLEIGVDNGVVRLIRCSFPYLVDDQRPTRFSPNLPLILRDECLRLNTELGPDCLIEEWSWEVEDPAGSMEMVSLKPGAEPEARSVQKVSRIYCRDYITEDSCISVRYCAAITGVIYTPLGDRVLPADMPGAVVSYSGPLAGYGSGLATGREGYELGQHVDSLLNAGFEKDSFYNPELFYSKRSAQQLGFGEARYTFAIGVRRDEIWRIDCEFLPIVTDAEGNDSFDPTRVGMVLRDQAEILDRMFGPDCRIEDWQIVFGKRDVPLDANDESAGSAKTQVIQHVRDYIDGDLWVSLRYMTGINLSITFAAADQRQKPQKELGAKVTYSGRLGDYPVAE